MVDYPILLVVFVAFLGMACAVEDSSPFREVSFQTPDRGKVFANRYGEGDHGVILAHGMVFDKESWHPLAMELKKKGYVVLAIDFRGYGKSTPGSKKDALHEDILGAVSYLRDDGMDTITVIGGSMGGGAAARAAVKTKPGEIDNLILLSPVPIENPEEMKVGNILYVASKDEKLMPDISDQFDRAPGSKSFELLDGDSHAQHIFKSDQAKRLTEIIHAFLEV